MLSHQLVYDAYCQLVNSYGKGSCGGVQKALAEQGIINKDTGRPYSRQAIRVVMSRTPEGRILMEKGVERKLAPPIVVDKREGVRAWLEKRGVGFKFISDPKVADIEGRYVYGNLPFELAVHARSIWLPVLDNEPVVADVSVEELDSHKVELGEYKIKRIR